VYIALQRHSVTWEYYYITYVFCQKTFLLDSSIGSVETWTRILDEWIYVIYLDYCKAFDSVPRKQIIAKFSCSFVIEKHGVASVASLLSDREMRVTAKQQESAWVSVGYSPGFHGVLCWHPYCFLVNGVQYGIDIPTRIKSISKWRHKIMQKDSAWVCHKSEHKTTLSVLRNGTWSEVTT